jgi:hypothetical protein
MALTHEQHILLNQWARYGPQAFVQKVRSGWTVTVDGYTTPTVFTTKRAALEQADNQVLALSRAWRASNA